MTDFSRVDKLLAGISTTRPQQRGNLIFALDATASRERAWDLSAQLMVTMFAEVATLGSLDLQLAYFRGMIGVNAECKTSPWVSDPMVLAKMMAKIKCETGYTQIGKVLSHISRESSKRTINAAVYVGDACEEEREVLIALASREIPVFMFQEGRDHTAQIRFQEIAELTHGAYHRFDQGSARQLAELLKAVATFAVGGVVALQKQDSDVSRFLLGQMKG